MSRSEALELGAGLPAWTLRGLIAATSAAITAVLAASGIGGPALVLLGMAGLLSVLMPASPAPALVVLLVAMSVAATGTDPFTGGVLALVPLVHLLHVSCAIAGLLPASARVHPSALRVPAVRFLLIQAGVFALAGLMAAVPVARPPAALEFAAIVGVAGIALLVIWLLDRAA